MSSGDGFLCVYQQADRMLCRVIGRATMRQSPPLRRHVEQRLAAGPVTLHVDLRECTYMDSTFLGMLVMLRRQLVDRGRGGFALVAPSAECDRLLRQMGLGHTFSVACDDFPPGARPADDEGEVLSCEPGGDTFRRTIVEAHQELAGLSGPAGAIFRDVAAQLTQEWDAEKARAEAER